VLLRPSAETGKATPAGSSPIISVLLSPDNHREPEPSRLPTFHG
jgi:hypothetical protein